MKRKKLVINKTIVAFLLFIVICAASMFVALDRALVLSKLVTIGLIFILLFSLVNYLDTTRKLKKLINYFSFAGFIASIYILLNADFTELTRFGSLLGNVNAIGIIVGISATFSFYIWLTQRCKIHLIMLVIMLPIILITGSRKALFFILLNFLIILFLRNSRSIKKVIKFTIFGAALILFAFYLIYHIPFLYYILGIRVQNFIAFITGEGTREASLNLRSYMTEFGLRIFQYKPWLGYGIDNYRVLLGREIGLETYSHNNMVELLVGTGVVGLIAYYLTHFYALKSLYRTFVMNPETTIAQPFIAIILSYTLLSVSMVYYDEKHISIILAIGSLIGSILRQEKVKINPS